MSQWSYNKEAGFNYEILEKFEAGLKLLGFEVKAIKAGKMNLAGSYVGVRGDEAFLIGASIAPYQVKNTPEYYEPTRTRKLLLNKKELTVLANFESKKGLTIIPISVYNKGRHIKLEVAVARGKKRFDKRQTIKKRETERDMRRTLKTRYE